MKCILKTLIPAHRAEPTVEQTMLMHPKILQG